MNVEAADRLRESGDYGGAWDLLEKLSRARPEDPDVWVRRADAAFKTARPAEARRSLETAGRLKGAKPRTRLLMAAVWGDIGETGRALDQLAALTREFPRDPDMWIERADTNLQAKKAGPALEAARRAAALPLPDWRSRLRLSITWRELKDYDRARALLRGLAAERPQDPEIQLCLAEAEARAGRKAEALSALKRAQELSPRPDSRLRVAALWRALGDADAALAELARQTASRPEDPDPWIEQADAAKAAGRRALVLSSLARARALAHDPERRRRIALLYQENEEYLPALEILGGLADGAPKDPASWSDLGICQFRAGKQGPGEESLRRALALDPAFLPAALSLGAILAGGGRAGEAVAVYDRALKAPGGDANLRSLVSRARAEALAVKR